MDSHISKKLNHFWSAGGLGTVGRVITVDYKGPWIETHPQQELSGLFSPYKS